MASIAGLYGGYSANQEDGSGGRQGLFRGGLFAGASGGWRSADKKRGGGDGGTSEQAQQQGQQIQTLHLNDE